MIWPRYLTLSTSLITSPFRVYKGGDTLFMYLPLHIIIALFLWLNRISWLIPYFSLTYIKARRPTLLYSAASSLSDRSKCFTPWHIPVHSDTNSVSPGNIQQFLQLLCEDFTRESPAFYHIMLADCCLQTLLCMSSFAQCYNHCNDLFSYYTVCYLSWTPWTSMYPVFNIKCFWQRIDSSAWFFLSDQFRRTQHSFNRRTCQNRVLLSKKTTGWCRLPVCVWGTL